MLIAPFCNISVFLHHWFFIQMRRRSQKSCARRLKRWDVRWNLLKEERNGKISPRCTSKFRRKLLGRISGIMIVRWNSGICVRNDMKRSTILLQKFCFKLMTAILNKKWRVIPAIFFIFINFVGLISIIFKTMPSFCPKRAYQVVVLIPLIIILMRCVNGYWKTWWILPWLIHVFHCLKMKSAPLNVNVRETIVYEEVKGAPPW